MNFIFIPCCFASVCLCSWPRLSKRHNCPRPTTSELNAILRGQKICHMFWMHAGHAVTYPAKFQWYSRKCYSGFQFPKREQILKLTTQSICPYNVYPNCHLVAESVSSSRLSDFLVAFLGQQRSILRWNVTLYDAFRETKSKSQDTLLRATVADAF